MRARRGQSATMDVRPSSRTRSVDVHAHAHGRAFKSARGRGCLRVSLLQPAPHLSGSHVVVSVQRHCWLAPQLGVFPRRCKFNQEWCTEARKQTAAPPRIRQGWKLAVRSVWCAWAALATPCSLTAQHVTTRVARNVRMRCSRMVGAVQSVGGQSMLCCVCLVPKNIDGCHRIV